MCIHKTLDIVINVSLKGIISLVYTSRIINFMSFSQQKGDWVFCERTKKKSHWKFLHFLIHYTSVGSDRTLNPEQKGHVVLSILFSCSMHLRRHFAMGNILQPMCGCVLQVR